MAKKQVSVKASIRKGKLVKKHNRLVGSFVSKDKKGKRKLTTLSKVLLGTLGLAALGYGGTKGYLWRTGHIASQAAKRTKDGKIVQDLRNPMMEAAAKAQAAAHNLKNTPDLTTAEKAKVRTQIENSFKKEGSLTTKETGDNFFNLIERRKANKRSKYEPRWEKLRGVGKDYNYEKDYAAQMRKNLREQGKAGREERRRLAKLIKQRYVRS